MDTPKVGSPRSTDSPRRLPDNGTAPVSPRTSTPRVLNKERDQMLLVFGKNDSLSQLVFEIVKFTDEMQPLIPLDCRGAQYLKGLISQISVGLAQVETAFERSDLQNCVYLLDAAKGNHVTLLTSLQTLQQQPDDRSDLQQCQTQCKTLGVKIIALKQLITERLNAEQQHQQQMPLSPRPSSPLPSSPPSSSPGFSISPERSRNRKTKKTDAALSPSHGGQAAPNSPERGTGDARLEKMPSPTSGKRAQGDEDSPKMKYSPAKRYKVHGVENPASLHSQSASGATVHSSNATTTATATTTTTTTNTNPTNPTNNALLVGPRSPIKVPKLDWSSAKPANTAPHSSLSMTPRSTRQASTDSKGNEKQLVDNAPALSPAPSSDAGMGADGNGNLLSTPASPSSLQFPSTLGSPRRRQLSPSKSIPPQPRPRPSSMLFMSPPAPSGPADLRERSSENNRDSIATAPPVPASTQTSTGTAATHAAPREEDTSDM
ncbi:hypothetical protein KTQ42_05615|uniref:hypothetical protein n=1 Tax=Noviherbaspirillum sp. L7-7A TaxID=2850560 RepID=UPI001C2C0AC4|nr:hypothetical protein [Noviherbaspirillum sp. L7-7A]MBV0878782.1 hypothetical protein [Noviherbaspirillum sp. L7-7A]